ncbi:putative DNA-binding WGR domain protein [Elusimicrobium posterum]|uniref:DUF6138 family protein n=1 Tax=Elusimicrobium posterum TaxID=3116653 RepID=UPI003C782200
MEKYVEFSDGKSNKFWRVKCDGNDITITFGKIGTAGQTQQKSFPTPEAAIKEAEKQFKSKVAKGYVEKDAPSGGEVPAPKAKTEVKTAAPKTPAPQAKPKAPADKTDDGTVQKWHGEDFFEGAESYLDEEEFKNIDTPEAQKAPLAADTPAVVAAAQISKEEGFDDDDEEEEGGLPSIYSFESDCDSADFPDIHATIAKLKEFDKTAEPEKQQLKRYLKAGLKEVFEHYRVSLKHIDVIDILIKEGVDYQAVCQRIIKPDDDYGYGGKKPLFKLMAKTLLENPDIENLRKVVDEYCKNAYKKIAGYVIEDLERFIKFNETGEPKDIRKDTSYIPRGRFAQKIRGLEVDAGGKNTYISGVGMDLGRSYSGSEHEEMDSFDKDIKEKYLPEPLKPLLEDMAKKGKFNNMANGHILIVTEDLNNVLLDYVTDQKILDERKKVFEANAAILETSEDWKENAKILRDVIETMVFGSGVAQQDPARALKILLKHIYSANEECEDLAKSLFNQYDTFKREEAYAQWELEYLVWRWNNMDYVYAYERLDKILERYPGFAPALEKQKEWEKHPYYQNWLNADSGEGKKKEKNRPIGSAAQAKAFFKMFKPEEVYLKTPLVTARALSTSRILIKFHIEGEEAYGQVLDFLNSIMEKGYSDDHFDGFSMSVRFVDKPVFIQGLDMPKTIAHAFFAKAVMYESLHEKICKFTDTVLQMYNHDNELQDEDCSVAGDFAAAALAMYDIKYISYAGLYGRNADGEHDEIQLRLINPLIKKYGVTPETVGPLFDLVVSFEQGYSKKYPQDFYTVPQNLTAIMDHLSKGYYSDRNLPWKITSFVEHVIKSDMKAALKVIKSYAQNAQEASAKNAYVDFYNFIKAAMQERDSSVDYGEDLAGADGEKKDITIEKFEENPPCVITKEEAVKRGIKLDEIKYDYSGRYCIVFTAGAEENPYIVDFVRKQWESLRGAGFMTTLTAGRFLFTMDKKWVIDLSGAPLRYGVVCYDGKTKPVIMYGLFKFGLVLKRFYKRPYRGEYEYEEARVQNLVDIECPKGSPFMDYPADAYTYFDNARAAMFDDRFWRAEYWVGKLKPEDGIYYNAGLIYRAKFAKLRADKQAGVKVFEELLQRLPQYKEYWQAKIDKLKA